MTKTTRKEWEERFDEKFWLEITSEGTRGVSPKQYDAIKSFIKSELDAAYSEGYQDGALEQVKIDDPHIRQQERQKIINLLEERFLSAKNPEFKAGIAYAQNLIEGD